MKKYSKILVLVLSLALIIGAIAIVASADNGKVAKIGDVEYETLAAALDAAEEGATVTLTADATIGAYTVAKSVTIDLGGKTLTATEESAFTVSAGKTFNVTGKGTINAAGTLVKAEGAGTVVNISTVNNGMDINHDGSVAGTLFYFKAGEINMTGLSIIAGTKASNDPIFNLPKDGAAKLNVLACSIIADKADSVEDAVFMIAGNSEVRVEKSYVHTTSCFSRFKDGSSAEKPLYILDSNIVGEPYDVGSADTRKVNFLSGWTAPLDNPVVVENSYVQYYYRLWDGQKAGINFINSTLHHTGYSNSNTGSDMNISRYAPVTFDETSRIIWPNKGGMTFDKSGQNGSVLVKEGFRTNSSRFFNHDEYSSFVFPDGLTNKTSTTYKFVYDPYGDTECPYVLVDITKEGALTADTLGADTFVYDNASQIYSSSIDGIMLGDDATTNAQKALMNSLTIWNIGGYEGLGNVGVYRNGGNTAMRYWIPDYNDGEETRVVYFEGVDSNGNPQGKAPVMLFGYGKNLTLTDYKVIAYEIDIATDSEKGFPMIGIELQGNGTRATYLDINTDGTMGSGKLANKDNLANVSMADGEYHRLSVVYYTETKTVHFFVDNVFVGSANENSNNTTIQGMRIGIKSGTSTYQPVGSSVLFDNFVLRAFTDYQNGETKDAPTAAYYLSGLDINDNVTNTISVLGNSFNTIGEALGASADYHGRAPELNGNVLLPNVVTANGIIDANGYSINIGNGSYAADVTYDADGNIAYYEFNSAFNDLFVEYGWWIGGENDDIFDTTKYIMTTVKVGQIPTAPEAANNKAPWKMSADGKLLVSSIAGWNDGVGDEAADLAPVSVADARSYDPTNPYYVYPVMGEYVQKNVRWFIADANGNFLRGGNGNSIWGSQMVATFNFTYGETLVLVEDMLVYGQLCTGGIKASADGNKTMGIDLNGKTLTLSPLTAGTRKEAIWTIKAGETLNVYSSRPGGRIVGEGFNDSNKGKENQQTKGASGGNVFSFAPASLDFASNKGDTNHNAHLNIGTFNGMYAGNLTVEGATAVAAQAGDKTCTITIDGATLVRNSVDYMGLVFSRFFYGKLEIKNSNLVSAVTGGDTLIGGVSAAAVVTEGVLEATTAEIIVDNCNLIAYKNGNGIVSTNQSMGSLTFTNCYTNGKITRPSGLVNNVFVGENVAAHGFGEGVVFTEGVAVGAYNHPVTLAAMGITDAQTVTYNYIYTPATEVGKIADKAALQRLTVTFASNGYTGEGTVVVLGTFGYKTVKAEDIVKVTFKGIGENADTVVDYAKGGKLVVPTLEGSVGTVFSLVHDGTFVEALPETVTEAITLTPNTKADITVSGIKTNLSVYSDFVINLYVPAAYAEFVTRITDTQNTLETAAVTVDGVDYIKVSIARNAEDASKAATFVITMTEGEMVGAANVTVSVASYAEKVLTDAETTAEDKQLMYYVLNYANEAAKYFDGAADATVAALLETYAEAKGEGMADQTYANAIAELALGQVFASASVELTSAPAFVLTLKDGFAGTVTVTYGDKTRTYTVTADDDREIVVAGIKAYNFGANLTINAEGTIGEETVATENAQYNLDTFVKYHVESEAAESVACVALLKALYDYVACAAAYVG